MPVRFVDVHTEAGLDFRNVSGDPEQRFIVESISAGIASLDYNLDGFQDLFIVDGVRVDSASTPAGAGNRLYRNEMATANDRSPFFAEVGAEAGLARTGWGMGCAVGDMDEDGDPDLYVTYWGPDAFYRNRGNGTFAEQGESSGLLNPGWGTSAAFGDLDNDGLLDLYVANYLDFDLNRPPAGGNWCVYKGLNSFCGPEGVPAQTDRVFRNRGAGDFEDLTEQTAVADFAYPGLGVSLADLDDDGDLEVYVANDSEPNLLFRNDGNWQFAEIATLVGLAYSENGRAQAGMGVDAADFDHDGDLDIFVTNFSDDVNTLYRNQGGDGFADGTFAAGMGGVVRPYLGWATAFFDYDGDGWQDLFVANGHVYPQLEQHPAGLQYAQRNLLYRNRGGRFREVGLQAGPGWSIEKASRAAALLDYDNDGDTDVAVVNLNDEPTLLRNDGGNANSWLGLVLVGSDSNRDAIGARVTVTSGDLVQMRELHRARGFQGQCDPRLLFGLGNRDIVDSVVVRWPSGRRQSVELPPLRRYVEIREGDDEITAGPLHVPRPVIAAVPALQQALTPTPDGVGDVPSGSGERTASAKTLRKAGADYYAQGRYAEARKALRRVIEADPNDLPSHINLALVLYSGLGDYDAASETLEAAARRQPDSAPAHHLLGKVYLRQNRLNAAVTSLHRATRLASSWEHENWLGLAYMRIDSLQLAESAFSKAARLAPWEPRPHLHLSRVYESLDLPEAARRERTTFERLNPAHRRVEHYTRKVREYPDHARARLLLGQAYTDQGRLRQAAHYIQLAVQMDPQLATAHHAQGGVLQRQGKLAAAIGAYERARHIDPQVAEVHNDLGQAYHESGQFDLAVASYEEAIRLDPNLALAHSNLGMAYAMAGRLGDAVRSFRASIARDSSMVDAHDGLAQVYAAQGAGNLAIAEWETVLRLAPDHPRAAAFLRRARQSQGRP